MPAEKDPRTGQWRWRKWVTLPDGSRKRLSGTPPVNTKAAAEAHERKRTPERWVVVAVVPPEQLGIASCQGVYRGLAAAEFIARQVDELAAPGLEVYILPLGEPYIRGRR